MNYSSLTDQELLSVVYVKEDVSELELELALRLELRCDEESDLVAGPPVDLAAMLNAHG